VRPVLVVVLTGCGRLGFGWGAGHDSADSGGSESGGSDTGGSDSSSASDGSLATVGCIAGETPGPFSADFELGAPAWAMTYGQTPVQTMFANGVLVVAPGTANPPKFGGVTSVKEDFHNRRFFVEVPAMVNTRSRTGGGSCTRKPAC